MSERKKILYICPSSGIGGAETFLKNTWMGHNKNYFEPHYLLFKEGILADFLRDNQAPIDILTTSPQLSKPKSWLRYAKDLAQHIHNLKINLVHSTMAYSAFFSARTAHHYSKHIWFQHGPASGWLDTVASTLPHSGMMTNSQYTLQAQLDLELSLLPLNKNRKILVLPLGTPPISSSLEEVNSFKKYLLEKYHLSEKTMIITLLCRIQPWKGVHHLIEAISHIRQFPELRPIHVFIWGEEFKNNNYLKSLKEQAKGLPISFPGATNEKDLVLASSDVLVNASIQEEPFGLTLIEAMASGTAVIAPRWGGPLEIVEDGLSGLLYEPTDSTDLANKIYALAISPQKLADLKAGAFLRYKNNYQLSQMMNNLESFYNDIFLISE